MPLVAFDAPSPGPPPEAPTSGRGPFAPPEAQPEIAAVADGAGDRILQLHEHPGFLREATSSASWVQDAERILHACLVQMARYGAVSDFDFVPGHRVFVHAAGGIRKVEDSPVLNQAAVLGVIAALLRTQDGRPIEARGDVWTKRVAHFQEHLRDREHYDFGSSMRTTSSEHRFRCHVALSQAGIGMTVRLLPTRIPELSELGIPSDVVDRMVEMVSKRAGFALITGPTGSGKSTTLAALIDRVRRQFPRKIVTIEDPIEILYPNEDSQSLVVQQEVGRDVSGFDEGLRTALRKRPDIILLGETRETCSMDTCLEAVETGHVILTTLHTRGTISTIRRLLEFFPQDRAKPILRAAADSLLFVLSQGLLPTAGGEGRVLACEFWRTFDSSSKAAIRNFADNPASLKDDLGRTHNIRWSTSVSRLADAGTVTDETMRQFALDDDISGQREIRGL